MLISFYWLIKKYFKKFILIYKHHLQEHPFPGHQRPLQQLRHQRRLQQLRHRRILQQLRCQSHLQHYYNIIMLLLNTFL